MEKRTKAWRRAQTKRVQLRRFKIVKTNWFGDWDIESNRIGMLRKNHQGCGCRLCKPWKWKMGDKFIHSVRKRMYASKE